jgi:phenylpyruvate tautomerase PptA (4-oxalocrotonate tautomerase family)
MEVREIAGACGAVTHVVPTVWRSDPETVCILLDNPKTGRWLVITLDVREEASPAASLKEAS